MSRLFYPMNLAAKRLLELRLMRSAIVWTDVVHPTLEGGIGEDRDFLLDTVVAISLDASPNHAQREWLRLIFSRWHSLNPGVFRLIRLGDDSELKDVAGFTCVIPLSEDGINRYKTGRLSEWDFDKPGGDGRPVILAPGSEPSRNICIQAITLRQCFWRRYAAGTLPLKMLLGTLIEHLAAFNPQAFKVKPCLIADGNVRGAHILRNHGFQPLTVDAGTVDGRPLFLLDFAALSDTISLKGRMTISALERWMTLAGCISLASRFFLEREPAVLLAILAIDQEALSADLATGRPPSWTILAFARTSVSPDAQALKAAVGAAVSISVIRLDAGPVADWSSLRKRIGRDFVSLMCRDREIGYTIIRHLFNPVGNPSGPSQFQTPRTAPMDILTASQLATIVGHSVSTIDKLYTQFTAYTAKQRPDGTLPLSPTVQADLQHEALLIKSPKGEIVQRIPLDQLKSLTSSDLTTVESLNTSISIYKRQWEKIQSQLGMQSVDEQARLEEKLRYLAKQMSGDLEALLDFLEMRIGVRPDQRFLDVRAICRRYIE